MSEEQDVQTEEKREPTGEEIIVNKILQLESSVAFLIRLVESLGESTGHKLVRKEIPGGMRLQWEGQGRIVLP